MDIGKRIELIINEKKLSVRAFAKAIDCSDTAIGKIIARKNEPGYKILFAIIEKFDDISPEWLLTGQGEMMRAKGVKLEPEDQKTLVDLVSSQKNEIQFLKDKLEEKDKIISDLSRTNLLLVEKELKNDSAPYPGNKEKMNNAG